MLLNQNDISIVSQKNSNKSELENLLKLRDSYMQEFEKTGSKAAEIRYKFLNREIYGSLHRKALKEYDDLFKIREVFSMNRK